MERDDTNENSRTSADVDVDTPLSQGPGAAASGSDGSAIPVVWKQPVRTATPNHEPVHVVSKTRSEYVESNVEEPFVTVMVEVEVEMQADVDEEPQSELKSPLRSERVSTGASPQGEFTPSISGGSACKRPSMHYRPVGIQDVLEAMQEEEDAIRAGECGEASGACPYVVPGLFQEVCRQNELEKEDATEMLGANEEDDLLEEGESAPLHEDSHLHHVLVFTKETEAPHSDAVEAGDASGFVRTPRASHTIGPDDGQVDDVPDLEDAAQPTTPVTAQVNDDGELSEAMQEVIETVMLKELVARDALEAMANAEMETALLVAMMYATQPEGVAGARRRADTVTTTQPSTAHETRAETAGEDVETGRTCSEPQVDVRQSLPTVDDLDYVANAESAPAAVVRTPTVPSSKASTRSSPRSQKTFRADGPMAKADVVAAAPASPAPPAAAETEEDCTVALASESTAMAQRKASSLPADSLRPTPQKRRSSATIAETRPLLPALKRGPNARIQPYNALLESVHRTRHVPARPAAQPNVWSARPRAFLGSRYVTSTSLEENPAVMSMSSTDHPAGSAGPLTATLPRIAQTQPATSRHLIDQRRFYERGGQYNYKSLFSQQKKRETLMQLVAPLPIEDEI